MNTSQWPQDIVVKPMEEIVTKPSQERKIRPQKEQALNCPRCNSTHTKFCYYNNYSLSQPRYFCKTCRRYWTEGGSLRNIPVGGGSRKNKRSSSNSSAKRVSDLVTQQNPKIQETQDLNLGFSSAPHDFKDINELIQVPNFENGNKDLLHKYPSSSTHLSALELLNGITTSRGFNSFMPMPTTTDPNSGVYTSGFPSLAEFRPSLTFSLDGLGSNYASFHGVPETNGKLLFPFEELKQVSSKSNDAEENRDQHGDSTGYWNGVIEGGSW